MKLRMTVTKIMYRDDPTGAVLDRLCRAVSMLHDLHINDRYFGSAESKLFPVKDEDGGIQWAVLARDLKEGHE
tara:strand:- start:1335 stop:1553 length:219 start_codon:yes stop_codon:yes gene_type:complete